MTTDVALRGEVVAPEELTTEELVTTANEEHGFVVRSAQDAAMHAHNAGLALNEAKGRLEHGEWKSWLAANFEGSERSAQVYMRIANTQHAADLGTSIRGVLRSLNGGPERAEPEPAAKAKRQAKPRKNAALRGLPDIIERFETTMRMTSEAFEAAGDDALEQLDEQSKQALGRMMGNLYDFADEWVKRLGV